MFQLLVEQYTTLVNCVQNWQGSTIKQQRLWVLLPTAVKNPYKRESEHYSFSMTIFHTHTIGIGLKPSSYFTTSERVNDSDHFCT